MKKRFTRILAALALLVGLTIPMGVWGQTVVTFIPGTDTGETSVTKGDITAQMTTMNNANYYQIYANQSGTFSTTNGNITKVEFTCTAEGTNKYGPGNASSNTGNYTYSGAVGTWTGSTQSVTISTTAQIRMTSLEITYIPSGSGQPNTYTITYKAGEGTGSDVTDTKTEGVAYTILGQPEGFSAPTGKVFDGWLGDDNSSYAAGDTYSTDAALTLTAQWTENTTPSGDEQWVLTNLADLTATDVFVIVGNNGNNYAMSNDKGTSAAPVAVAVTVSGNNLTGTIANAIQWTISGNATDGYTFYPNGSTTTWLYCTNTNNGVRVGTNAAKTFTLDATSGYLKHSGTSRYVGIYNSQDWRCYTSSGGNIDDQTFAFYKKVTGGVIPPSITAEDVNIPYDATSGSIAYTIDNPVDGVSLGATTDANWISNITVGDESVTFTTTVNEGTEDRTATFILTYEGADDKEITVTQGHPVVDYATLPFTWDDAATPTGVTRENVGSYTSSPRLKFNNNTGEGYVILKVNETPGAIVFDIKANPGSGTTSTGIFSVMTSNDGTDYNTLVTYNSIINQKQTLCITNISADTRYIKWSYDKTTSTSGNVAVGNIIVTKAVEIANNTTWTAGTNTPEDNYTYVVNDDATLTLNGDYSIYFDKPYYLVVKDGGQLVAEKPGQGTMQKNIVACDYNDQNNAGYNLIASPVSTNLTATNVVGLLTNDYDLYKFDNTADLEWINYKASPYTIDPEVGYLYASGSNTVVEFAGALNGYEELYEVTIPNVGFNLIGNPFACDVYVYDESSDAMNFQVLNGAGQEFTDGSIIKAGEAFLVQTTKANQKLYFNHEQISKASAVTMNVEKNRGSVIDNVRVRFGEGHGMNKFYLNENGTHIFIPQGNEEMAVAYSAAEAEMPVSFRASENGTYTLAVEAENVDMNYLHLIDNLTGMDVDLLQTPSYTFDAKTSDYANRFKLVFAANSTDEADESSFAFFSNGNLIVNNEGNATLQVIDINGRILSSETISGSCSKAINATTGVYMLRLINGENVKVQKVVVR